MKKNWPVITLGLALLAGLVAPFADLGVAGAIATRSRNLGGTDSTSFNNAGLAGIGNGSQRSWFGDVGGRSAGSICSVKR